MNPMVRIGIVFAVLSSFLFAQATPFNQGYTTAVYPTWVNYDTLNSTTDVIHLRGGWDGFSRPCSQYPDQDCFCDQIISNASIVPGPSGKWYIYTYGDHKLLGDPFVGDGGMMVVRNSDGKYDLVPNCHSGFICIPPVYNHMEARIKFQSVGSHPWTDVGGMGQRMAVFYSAQGDAGGNHYFALVKVTDFGDPDTPPPAPYPAEYDNKHYFIWAVSQDGIDWYIERRGAAKTDCLDFDEYLTVVPRISHYWDDPYDQPYAEPILFRECLQSDITDQDEYGNEVFDHYGVFFSDPALVDASGTHGDGYVYVLFGYTPSPAAGVNSLLVRFPFDPTDCTGRGGPIQIHKDSDSAWCDTDAGQWQTLSSCSSTPSSCTGCGWSANRITEPGCIPCAFARTAGDALYNQYLVGVPSVFDWTVLKDKLGRFYASALAYHPTSTFGKDRIGIRFTRNIRYPFTWSEERELNTCLIDAAYSTCEAGGLNVGLYQPSFSQFPTYYNADGSPAKAFGFFGHKKITAARPSCGHASCTQESAGLLPAQIDLTNSPPLGEVPDLRVQKGVGNQITLRWTALSGPLVQGYHVFEGTLAHYVGSVLVPHGIPFSACAADEEVFYDHFRTSCEIPQPAVLPATVSVTITPTETDARYWIVVPFCHRRDEGSCGYSSSGRERLTAVCQCGPDAVNCYHYWNQGYGRMHWPQPKTGGTP
jgi:hypothetical protein